MRDFRKPLAVALLLLGCSLVALAVGGAGGFARSCEVTGSKPQSVSSVLKACGYRGPAELEHLTVINDEDAPNDLAIGGADLNEWNGFKLAPGTMKKFPADGESAPVHAAELFLLVPTTQAVTLSLRYR